MRTRSRALSKERVCLPLIAGLLLSAALWVPNTTKAAAAAKPTACGPKSAVSAACPAISGATRLAFAARLKQAAARNVPTPACGAAQPGHAQCFAEEVANAPGSPLPGCLAQGNDAYVPCDLQSAYDLPSATNGTGRTVAVVDAFDDANAESDLAVYRSNFGLAPCTTANGCFEKVDQDGGTNYPGPPPSGDNWVAEIGLDLDMVSAICPNCHIILIEADSDQDNSLFFSEDEAVTLGATEITNSWGGQEFTQEASGYDQYFNHAGVAITASTGDDGYGVAYPAASPYVTAVGGTDLSPSTNARGWIETAWNGAGSGCSGVEARPSWQSANTNITSRCARRADADVSAVADTGTPVYSYDSAGGGWIEVGGTSVASPIIASVDALTTSAPINNASYIYSHTSGLNDVTSGSNGSCGGIDLCTAGSGWDGPTGLGTPDGTTAFGVGVPIIRSVTPASGPVAGGQVITVAGTGFAAGMTVTIGGTAVTPSTVSYASFTLTTPAEAAGTDDIQVTTSGGVSALRPADVYTYIAPANYVPMTPFRIFDTRGGAPLGPNSSRTVQITGVGSIPSAAVAVVLNVTEVNDTAASLLTVYPAGNPKPNASNLNFNAGTITPNLVTVTLGSGGGVVIYNAAGSVNVIADVEGYFEPPASATPLGEFHPIYPVRVCDTRSTTLASSACKTHGVLVAGSPMLVTITTGGQIPGGGMAVAAVLNLTAVVGTAATYVSVYPPLSNGTCSGTPGVSTLNLLAGAVEANRVMVELGPGPSGPDTAVCVFASAGRINVLLDANGWFGTAAAPTGYQYQAIVPSRICDTRGASAGCAAGSIGAGQPGARVVAVDGVGGVPAATSGTVVQAVIANLTATRPTVGTYLVTYPADQTAPSASDINLVAGATLPNLVVVQLDTSGDTHNGDVDLLNSVGSVNAIIDIEGWFQ